MTNGTRTRRPPPVSVARVYALGTAVVALCLTGCASSRVNTARENFYLGRPAAAVDNLKDVGTDDPKHVLELMERGMAYQAMGRYQESVTDWVAAHILAEKLDYYSVSKGAGSLVVNDRILNYTGAPYERTLLHAFAAQSYMALGLWDDAAVEARNLVGRLEKLDGFPDDAYARYVAALSFAMIRDFDGAALEYRAAGQLSSPLRIDERTGTLFLASSNAPSHPPPEGPAEAELVCFVNIGRGPTEYGTWRQNSAWGPSPYADLYAGDRHLGRSYTLDTTQRLMVETQKRIAALQAAKTITRVVIKETVAYQISKNNQFLGELVRLLLYSMETSDTKRWETLPQWLQVARVPCPSDLKEFRVVFRGVNGMAVKELRVTEPLTRRDNTWVSFVRAL